MDKSKRYLLFDSGCVLCTSLAQKIESEVDGWLTVGSLRDTKMQDILSQARPDWKLEPTLLEIKGGRVRAYTGLSLRLRLISGLGFMRAWQVAQVVRQSYVVERRNFMKRGIGLTGAFVTWLYLGWSFPLNRILASEDNKASGFAKKENTERGYKITAKSDIKDSIYKQIQSKLEGNLNSMGKKDLNNAISNAFMDNNVRNLSDMLIEKGFTFKEDQSSGIKFNYLPDKGELVQLQYKAKDKYAHIYYTKLKGVTKVGALVYHNNGKTVYAYDVVDNIIYNTSITNYKNGKPETEWIEGPYKELIQLQNQKISILSEEDDCTICLETCAYIYAVGCSISSVLTCSAACAPFGGLTCPIICGIIWAVICLTSQSNTCPWACEGYCT